MLSEIYVRLLETVLGLLGIALIKASFHFWEWLKTKTKNEAVQRLLDKAEKFTEIAVQSVEQTMVPALVEAAKDGRITAEEGKGLKLVALAKVRAMMGQQGMVGLVSAIGETGVDHYLDSLVEAMVFRHTYPVPVPGPSVTPSTPPPPVETTPVPQ